MNNRRFGIELEMLSPSLAMGEVAAKIRASGVPCVVEAYGHATPSGWKIVTDASLNSGGMELVSPILSGETGLEQIEKICEVLVSNGIVIDKSCGFHVHVNARDLSGPTLANVMVRYARHELLIDSFMPKSRRASENRHCKSVNRLAENFENVLVRNPTSVANLQSDRYYKLNLSAFIRHGTIEFRQHSGTIAYEKIKNWVLFCLNFVETSQEVVTTLPQAQGVVAGIIPRTSEDRKFALLANCLASADDFYAATTTEEIARALSIHGDSVPGYISRFRARFPQITIKNRRNYGYYCNTDSSVITNLFRVVTNVATYSIPPDNGAMAGLDQSVIDFFSERSQFFTRPRRSAGAALSV